MTTQEALEGILGHIAKMNGEVSKLSSAVVGGKMGAVTSPVPNPTQGKSGSVKMSATDAAGAVKALSSIKLTDVVKMSIVPFDKLAKKLVDFTKEMGKITKADSDAAKNTAEAMSIIVNVLGNLHVIRLSNQLKMFPNKAYKDFVAVAMEPLLKYKKKDAEVAKDAAQAIKSVLSVFEDINSVSLFLKLKLFPSKALAKFLEEFSDLSAVLTKKFNATRQKTIDDSVKCLKGFSEQLQGMIAKTAIIGLLTPVLIPLSALGFLGMLFVMKGYELMSKLVSIEGSEAKAKKNSDNIKNILYFAGGILGIIAASIALGLFVTKVPGGLAMLGLGFLTTTAVIFGFAGIAWVLNKMFDNKKAADQKQAVLNVLGFAGASILILMASAAIGFLLLKFGGWKFLAVGMAAIAGTILLFGGIAWLLGKMEKTIKKAILPAIAVTALAVISGFMLYESLKLGEMMAGDGVSKVMNALIGSVSIVAAYGLIGFVLGKVWKDILKGLAVTGAVLLLASFSIDITGRSMDLGERVAGENGWKAIGLGLAGVVTIIGGYTAIALAIGGLMMIPFLPLILGAGLAALTGISATVLVLTKAALNTMKFGEMAERMNPDRAVGLLKSFALSMRPFLKSMRGLAKGISFGEINKTIYAMNGIILVVGRFVRLLSKMGSLQRKLTPVDENGNPTAQAVDIQEVTINIADAFSYFAKKILTTFEEIGDVKNARKVTKRVNALIYPVSRFVDIIKGFAGGPGKIRAVYVGEDGKLTYGEVMDIVAISENIANGFSSFAEITLGKLKTLETSYKDILKIGVIELLINPVSKFTEILKGFAGGPGKMRAAFVDSEGKVTYGEEIEVDAVVNNISSAFGLFANNVLETLRTMDMDYSDFMRAMKLSVLFKPVHDFIISINESFADEEARKLYTDNIATMATGLEVFKERILPSVENLKNDTSSTVYQMRDVADSLRYYQRQIKGAFDDDDERGLFEKNSETMAKGLKSLQGAYSESAMIALNKHLPNLTKNHENFMSKLTKSLKTVQSPLEKYVKSVEKLAGAYDRLQKTVGENAELVLTLDERQITENNYKYDMNEKSMANIYEGAAPIIAREIAKVLNNMSMTMPKIVKNGNDYTFGAEGCEFAAVYE